MAATSRTITFILAASLTSVANAAQTLSQVSLSDAVSAAELRLPSEQETGSTPYQTSAWLAALPSLSVSYLASDEDLGSDETELSLNLPIKSIAGKRYDEKLRSLSMEIQDAETRYRRLYLSGLVRESLWTERIAATRASFNAQKIDLLEDLQQRQQALFEARSASRYSLLLIRQELTQAKIEQQNLTWVSDSWRQRFRQLTGLSALPANVSEAGAPPAPDYSSHPQLRLLELDWQRQQAVIRAGSNSATPWNLALTAKQLDSPEFEENQYGLSLEVPMSVFDVASESSQSDWQDASRAYWRAHDEVQLGLEQQWQALTVEASQLKQQQSLLNESVEISGQLITETKSLIGQNELGPEIWLRRLLGDIDKQADAAINSLRIGQNHAMTRQAAGIPL